MDNNNTTLSFSFQDLPVRVIERNGEPWFVGKDVCNALEINDARKSVALLDEDERNTIPVIDAVGRMQDTYIISESGLYSLVLRSRKPEAKVFKRWVTHEVLPAIRKTGKYAVRTSDAEKVLAEALLAAAEILREYRGGNALPALPEESVVDSSEEVREFFSSRGIGSFIDTATLANMLNISKRVVKNAEHDKQFHVLDKSVYATESVVQWLIRKPRYLMRAPIERTFRLQREYSPSPSKLFPSRELLNMQRTSNRCPVELVRGNDRMVFPTVTEACRFLRIDPKGIQPRAIRNLVIDGWYFITAPSNKK